MSSKAFELKYQLQGGFLCSVAECLKIRQGPVKKTQHISMTLTLI